MGRRRGQLLPVLRARDGRRPLSVRPAGRRGRGRTHPAHEPDRPPVARLPAGRAAGTPVRLPGARAVRAARRASVQPEQAPPRSVRASDQRPGPVARRRVRLRDRPRGRGPLHRRARQRGLDAEVRGDRPRVHLGRGPATGDAVEPDRDLRDPREGHDEEPPVDPAGDPRHVPRPRARPGRRAPPVPRRDGGRADAGAPVRGRPASRRAGPVELLGIQLDRVLRPPPRLRDALGRPAGLRVQVDGQDPAPRRDRGDPRRRLQPHRRGEPPRPDALAPRHRQQGVLPAVTRGPAVLHRLHRDRQQPQHAASARDPADHGQPPPLGAWRCTWTASASISRRSSRASCTR